MNLEGEFAHSRVELLDSLGKDNPLPRDLRTENSLSVSPSLSSSLPLHHLRTGRVSLASLNYSSSPIGRCAVHRSRKCCPSFPQRFLLRPSAAEWQKLHRNRVTLKIAAWRQNHLSIELLLRMIKKNNSKHIYNRIDK